MTTRRHIVNIPDGLVAYLKEEHAADRDALSSVWDACEDARHDPGVDSQRKAEVRRHILRVASRSVDRPVFRPSLRPVLQLFTVRGFAVAVSLALLVAISFSLSPDVNTVRAPIGSGSTLSLDLPDGSSVTLASGSVLSFSDSFGEKTRRVTLKGEAFFDVVTSDVSFVVDTYNARTTVHGTQFSVRAWADDIEATTDVRVEEGSVSVASRRSDDWDVLLSAGDAISVAGTGRDASESAAADFEYGFNWIEGGYEYRNEPVGNVLADLKRQYDVLIEAPRSVRFRPISIFNQTNVSLDEVLGDISATVGVMYRPIAGGYEFYEK
ncbi:MAG: hypothetical protein BMS9Abin05_2003 [Rhodothermia bacterium]|nr:MAG: hypothetical protein BMS9Abin05_2003 [Rhodothermia bacterium]